MSTFNSLQTHRLEKPYDYWVTWKTGFIKKTLISVKYDLGNGGFGLTTDSHRPIVNALIVQSAKLISISSCILREPWNIVVKEVASRTVLADAQTVTYVASVLTVNVS